MDYLWVLVELFHGAILPCLPSRFFQTMVAVLPFFCVSSLLFFFLPLFLVFFLLGGWAGVSIPLVYIFS